MEIEVRVYDGMVHDGMKGAKRYKKNKRLRWKTENKGKAD